MYVFLNDESAGFILWLLAYNEWDQKHLGIYFSSSKNRSSPLTRKVRP